MPKHNHKRREAMMSPIIRRYIISIVGLMISSCAPAQETTSQTSSDQAAAYQKKAHEEQLLNDWADLARYRAEDEAMPAPSEPETRVVFMGDSITENWGMMGNPQLPSLGKFFPGKPYVNRGITAQTSPQMLVRFRQDVIGLKPKVVVILAGANDIAENTGKMRLVDTENNLQSMSDLARANGIKVVLCSLLPAKDFWWHKGLDPSPKIKALNDWIRTYAAGRNFPYADYYSALVDNEGGLRANLTLDGVHPNGKGYAVMAPIAQNGIDAALKTE